MIQIEYVGDEYVTRNIRLSGNVPFPFFKRVYSAVYGVGWYINTIGYGPENLPVSPEYAKELEEAYKNRVQE